MKTTVVKFSWRILVLLVLCMANGLLAQKNHLNTPVSIKADSWPISKVLIEMETQGHFFFSYDSEIISSDSIVSIHENGIPVKAVLQKILGKGVDYKSIGNHIVLFKVQRGKPKEVLINGYIYDQGSKKPIVNATIYDPQNSLIATTNGSGYFEMHLAESSQKAGLTVSKSGYKQEFVYVPSEEQSNLNFELRKLEKPIEGVGPRDFYESEVDNRKIVKLMVPEEVMETSGNLTIFNRVPVQFSLYPGKSTSNILNSSSVNRVSINLLGGYSAGTKGLEMGLLVNINRTDMFGAQLAGLANYTGRDMKGFQAATIVNFNGNNFQGVQAAAISNTNMGAMEGVQMSAISNINLGTMEGVQIAAISNVQRGKMKGVQLAAISNYSDKDIDGAQLAVVSNVCRQKVNSGQLAVISNYARRTEGLQFSLFSNVVSDTNNSTQIALFINTAKTNNGTQLGLVNYADTSAGVPIGFVSIVKHGYHKLEVSENELLATGLAYKTGVNAFYNIFEASVSQDFFFATYGLGSQVALGSNLNLGFELKASKVFDYRGTSFEYQPNLFRFSMPFVFQPTKNFGVSIAPVLNYSVTKTSVDQQPSKISGNSFYENYASNHYEQAWIGARLSVLFL